MNVISVDKLTKVFPGGVRAVDSVELEVKTGEIFGFLGLNGAGKTTTIKMLNTLIRPTSGTAIISGYDIRKNAAGVRRKIGYVGQNVGVDEYATAWENLVLYGHFYRLDRVTLRKRVKDILDLVDLTGHENRMVSTYSGAACGNGWISPWASYTGLTWSFSMSPPWVSIRRPGHTYGTTSALWPNS